MNDETKAQHKPNVFANRLKEARKAAGMAQDRLGVLIGLDEHVASARMSRYESGIHQPPIETALLIAERLSVPLAYLYCEDDRMARILLRLFCLDSSNLAGVEKWLEDRLNELSRLGNRGGPWL